MLSSDQPGEIAAGANMLNRALAAVGYDLHSAADVFTAALLVAREPPRELPPRNSDDDPLWLRVDYLELYRHDKATGGWPTARVVYACGDEKYFDWWAFEHRNAAKEIAAARWRQLGGRLPIPQSVDEAVERQGELAQDVEIQVRLGGRYPEVVGQRQIGAAS
jgi:hypothetical protein